MRIVLLCEGKTEVALKDALKRFLDEHCRQAGWPKVGLDIKPFNGPAVDCKEIADRLERYASRDDVLAVVALTDVHPKFSQAADAKKHLNDCVKDSTFKSKFFAHVAQYDFEAWLLPFWDRICKRLKVNAKCPGANPEQVDNEKPPSAHLKELYQRARNPRRSYEKGTEPAKILRSVRIEEAAEKCHELKSLLDTLVTVCKQAST